MHQKTQLTLRTVLPSLEKKNDVAAADYLVGSIDELESHVRTHLMKEFANLSARNAAKRAQGGKKGGAADKQ